MHGGGAVSWLPSSRRRHPGVATASALFSATAMNNATPPDPAEALEDQQQLAESSLASIFEAYDEALEDGVADPVVFVLDCEDPLGGEISRAWLGDETVEQAIAIESAAADEEGRTTVFVAAFPMSVCKAEAPKVFPYLRDVFNDPPDATGVLVVSVTSGGASALTAPMDARP